jgi:hypothetical protein
VSSSIRNGRRVTGHDDETVTQSSVAPSIEQAEPVVADHDAANSKPPQHPATVVNRPTKAEHLAELRRLLEESAAVEVMLLDVVAGRGRPAAQESNDLQATAPRARRRRLLLGTGAAAIAALVAANAVALTQVNHDSKRTPRAAQFSPTTHVGAAQSWVGRELSHDAKIITDPATSKTLAAERFTHTQALTASSSGTALSFDYIVSTAALRAAASAGNPIDRALRSSLPIAVFGSGSDQVVVRQVSTISAADVAARRRADSDTRRTAGRQLLANPAVRADGPARAALQAGQLDLRPATVVALMANASHIVIVSVNVDPAQQAAGLPARSMDIQTDATGDVQAMLTNLAPLYRPITDRQLPNGTHRMVWSIDPEQPPALN